MGSTILSTHVLQYFKTESETKSNPCFGCIFHNTQWKHSNVAEDCSAPGFGIKDCRTYQPTCKKPTIYKLINQKLENNR